MTVYDTWRGREGQVDLGWAGMEVAETGTGEWTLRCSNGNTGGDYDYLMFRLLRPGGHLL